MNLKTLFWKEYRQSRQLLVSICVVLSIPYVIASVGTIVLLTSGEPFTDTWSEGIAGASVGGMFISSILCAFLAAQVMASERVDRSAEFAAYLPITPGASVAAKAVFAVGVGTVMLLLNVLVNYGAETMQHGNLDPSMFGLGDIAGVLALLMFGSSWLISSIVARPSTGAAAGLLSVVILGMLLAILEKVTGLRDLASGRVAASVAIAVGLAGFFAGTLWTLRRVEP